MIIGSVDASREAVIKIELLDSDGNRHLTDAVIDTGFNRHLGLPAEISRALSLRKLGQEPAEFGNGSIEKVNIYEVVVVWDGSMRSIIAHETKGCPLVGIELIAGYELRIQVAEGGAVTIEAMA
jgi:predicted aspartyl protease